MIGAEHPQWRLDIFGSGTMEEALNARIAAMESANNSESGRQITIHPFTNTIASEYATSSIFALSSRFEGFGLVLLEAMQHGLPCVVFDCPFGPSDVVANGECGFVVPDGDITAFARQLARLMDDEPLRQRFAAAARERAKRFSVEKVMEQWRDLFLKGTQP
jgi:glycosyltransferase involved in cell wall biosynthesis